VTAAELRGLARELLDHLGVEPTTEEEAGRAARLRARLALIADGEQPEPKPTSARPIWVLVIEDMLARDQLGRQRYGVPLQAGNGRDALRDAYEEALDLAAYLRQELEERRAARGDA